MTEKPLVIAIDGPAGAGKSTIARLVAQKLKILYLDTGAMYRACAWQCVEHGVSVADEPAVNELIAKTKISLAFVDGKQHIFVDEKDITAEIRSPEMSKLASDVSKLPGVRHSLLDLQRQIAAEHALVADGRDMGTHVFPDADLKIFLTATPEERAKRRFAENEAKWPGAQTYEEVLADIEYRDRQDSSRKHAPLRQAEDAILIDSTDLAIEEVVSLVLAYLAEVPETGG